VGLPLSLIGQRVPFALQQDRPIVRQLCRCRCLVSYLSGCRSSGDHRDRDEEKQAVRSKIASSSVGQVRIRSSEPTRGSKSYTIAPVPWPEKRMVARVPRFVLDAMGNEGSGIYAHMMPVGLGRSLAAMATPQPQPAYRKNSADYDLHQTVATQ
jgi:hypothetical protein